MAAGSASPPWARLRLGRSGLGLEAQQSRCHLHQRRMRLVESSQEIKSGKRNARPELAKALKACRRLKAKLGNCKA